jgi:hypothetical protein
MPVKLKNVESDARANRAKTQKIFLANRNVDDKSATFEVLGSTGNIYTVALDGVPKCTCPDHCTRNSRCKHILFMLIKIFNVVDPYQENFTQDEISQYIDSYKANISRLTVTVDPSKHKCAGSIGYDVGEQGLDDDCCVCLDPVLNGEDYVHCKQTCGRCVHIGCYNMIKKINKNCPYCMQKLVI